MLLAISLPELELPIPILKSCFITVFIKLFYNDYPPSRSFFRHSFPNCPPHEILMLIYCVPFYILYAYLYFVHKKIFFKLFFRMHTLIF